MQNAKIIDILKCCVLLEVSVKLKNKRRSQYNACFAVNVEIRKAQFYIKLTQLFPHGGRSLHK